MTAPTAGERLRTIRRIAGLSQSKFAELCCLGCAKSVQRRENNQAQITISQLACIAKQLDWVSVEWLVTGKGEPVKGNIPD